MGDALADNAIRTRAARSGSRMMHGGYTDVPALDPTERAHVDAIIDTLIPPEGGWPPAAELGIADLLTIYLVPQHAPISLFPHFTRAEFPAIAERIAGPVLGQGIDARVSRLRAVEAAEPELFARVRDFVYYVYYGHPAVVALIQAATRFGGAYHGGPQPEGYDEGLETWGDRQLVTRGVFIPTGAVLRAPQAVKEHA